MSVDPLHYLIRRVRRRWMFAHGCRLALTATMIAAFALVVAALALQIVPIAINTLYAGIVIAGAILVTALIGVARKWPSDARVARHIDEALELRELLASGLASTGEDAASTSVRAIANDTARRTRPEEVLERFPSRDTFAVAAVLLSAALVSNHLITSKPADAPTPIRALDADRPAPRVHESSSHAGPPGVEPSIGEPGGATSPVDVHGTEKGPSSGSTNERNQIGRDAAGGGAGGTDERSPRVNLQPATGTPTSSEATDKASSPARGVSPAAVVRGETGMPSELGAGASSLRTPSTDQSDQGRSGSDSAHDVAPSGAASRIPDRHRALVRAYFDAAPTSRPTSSLSDTSR